MDSGEVAYMEPSVNFKVSDESLVQNQEGRSSDVDLTAVEEDECLLF